MLVPTAMRRGWTDTPDGTSLEDIQAGEIEYANHGLQQRGKNETFLDKTWVSFAVRKGGDDVLWGRRRALIEAEKAVQYINRQETSALLKSADYERARTALDAAQQAEQESRSGITFVSPWMPRVDSRLQPRTTRFALPTPSRSATLNIRSIN